MSYTVAVRALCEFTARTGDLDLRFTPAPSALEGMAGHSLVQSRRSKGYETEIKLTGRYDDLVVRGRADGFDGQAGQLEEIKTYRGLLDSVRPHHGESRPLAQGSYDRLPQARATAMNRPAPWDAPALCTIALPQTASYQA